MSNLTDWTHEQVLNWLTVNNFSDEVNAFTENKIRGAHLVKLNDASLKEMGVVALGTRLDIMEAINTLKNEHNIVEVAAVPATGPALTPSKLGTFWEQLKNAKTEKHRDSKWLTLPGQATWFGVMDLGNTLLIREAYETFWELLDTTTFRYVITGSPGIGKSFFGMYLFWKIRTNHPDATIVLKDDNTADYKVFFPDGKAFAEYHNVSTILEDPKNWYIADAVVPLFVNARTILVTSPVHMRYKEFLKKPGVDIRWMPIWTFDEIYALWEHKYQHIEASEMKKRVAYWGGVPRTLFPNEGTVAATTFLSRDENLVKDLSKCFESVGKSGYPSAVVSGRVMHLWTMNPYDNATVRFASNIMGDELLSKHGLQLRAKLVDIMSASAGISDLGGLRGTVFEPIAHRCLLNGGSFNVRNLETGELSVIDFPRSTEHHIYPDISSIRPLIYNQPVIRNFKTIDALIPPNTLFQITVSPEHPINVHGLKALAGKLNKRKKICFYFVLPSDIFQVFKKTQPFHTLGRQVYQKKDHFLDQIQQFALEVDSSMDNIANLYEWNN